MADSHPKRIAVVGSGCAGLAAVWALRDTPHDVHLYEAADRLGGHTNTVQWRTGKCTTAVDAGFIVLNESTYPNFINFLKEADVPLEPAPMTFSVSRDDGLEWAGASLSSLFCQRRNLFSPRFWRMLFDVIRFNSFAPDLLDQDDALESIGSYLEREGYSSAFQDDYLIPMTAAIWSAGPEKRALDFPAQTLIHFLWNHHLLSTASSRPQWLTLKNCAQSYVDAIIPKIPAENVFLSTPVRSLMNEPSGKVRLLLQNGTTALYDGVVLATHGDQAYSIVEHTATQEEREVLSVFETKRNRAVLHSDASLLPRNPLARSSCNYISGSSSDTGGGDGLCLTYDMSSLQNIPRRTFGDVLLSLNPIRPPRLETVQAEMEYSHPVYTSRTVAAQKRLQEVQGVRGIWYAGAWTGFGFHEDGWVSGLRAAEGLGAVVRWVEERCRKRRVGFQRRILRMVVWALQRLVVRRLERVFGRTDGGDREKRD